MRSPPSHSRSKQTYRRNPAVIPGFSWRTTPVNPEATGELRMSLPEPTGEVACRFRIHLAHSACRFRIHLAHFANSVQSQLSTDCIVTAQIHFVKTTRLTPIVTNISCAYYQKVYLKSYLPISYSIGKVQCSKCYIETPGRAVPCPFNLRDHKNTTSNHRISPP